MGRFPTTFDREAMPLTGGLGERANKALEVIDRKGYEAFLGLTITDALRIGEIAPQESIREYCWRDETASRFKNLETTAKWLTKGEADGEHGRAMGGIRRKGSGILAAYSWIGPEDSKNEDGSIKIPGANLTFAVRVGEEDQGNGLARPLTEIMVGVAYNIFGPQKHPEAPEDLLWLETWDSNKAAAMYDRAGFTDLPKLAEPGMRKNAAGIMVPDIRRFKVALNSAGLTPELAAFV